VPVKWRHRAAGDTVNVSFYSAVGRLRSSPSGRDNQGNPGFAPAGYPALPVCIHLTVCEREAPLSLSLGRTRLSVTDHRVARELPRLRAGAPQRETRLQPHTPLIEASLGGRFAVYFQCVSPHQRAPPRARPRERWQTATRRDAT